MKKILFSTFTALTVAFQLNAQVACTIDTSVIPAGKFSYPDTLPCVVRNVAYTQTVQFKVPESVDPADFGLPAAIAGLLGPFYIDSIVVTGVTGLPTGITPTYNPTNGVFLGGQGGCFKVQGTTNDPAGNYPATVAGTISVHANPFPPYFDGDTTFDLSMLSGMAQNPFGSLSLDVINQGAQCRPNTTGINTLSSFNAVIKTYPSPVHSLLNVDINTVDRINGSIQIVDMLGHKVYDEKIDLIGLMSKQINVSTFARGMYTIQITDANKGYKTKFVVE
jgi:hypothetical protein